MRTKRNPPSLWLKIEKLKITFTAYRQFLDVVMIEKILVVITQQLKLKSFLTAENKISSA